MDLSRITDDIEYVRSCLIDRICAAENLSANQINAIDDLRMANGECERFLKVASETKRALVDIATRNLIDLPIKHTQQASQG